jgi:TonB-linked SusC/RagA family outer membrane protein
MLIIVLCLFARPACAQQYSVDYRNQTLEEVIKDLRKRTGYEFMYKKQLLQGAPRINCQYKNLNLNQLLNRVLYQAAGIEYEIVKHEVILKRRVKDSGYFKKTITGQVVDENKEPLIGVTVMQRGTGNGCTTDVDGQFSLLVEGSDPQLDFSYIGMRPHTVKVSRSQSFILVKMEPDENLIDEVLVTGYQNIKRENAVGAYQTISAKELDERYTSDVVSRLEGQVPGLVAYNNGTNGSGESTLTIRGVSSFEARTNPLVVVDGLPIEGSIETVNPYDIESINVLKDASAASIYGARASNGVIVITTKRAHSDKLTIDVNADLTISEKQSYSNFGWANASQLLELEQDNFNYVINDENAYDGLLSDYATNKSGLSPAVRLLLAHHLGTLSDADFNAQMQELAGNDYRKEWRDVMLRTRIQHQYNVAFRTQGKKLNSNIVFNYKGDNEGVVKEHDNTFTLNYQGDLAVTKWLDLSFGINLINERTKEQADLLGYKQIYAFQAYQSMYNADGSLADMEALFSLDEDAFQDSSLGLKGAAFNLVDEVNRNFTKGRRNNIRTYIHANVKILPELSVSGKFQYEDITYKGETYYEGDSYDMRTLYNLGTSGGVHYFPEGGMLKTQHQTGDYYTFRAQANYSKTFAEKHAVDAIAGFEYRQTHNRYNNDLKLGYDEQTQTNLTYLTNLEILQQLYSCDINPNYGIFAYAPQESDFSTSDILHRYYSYYFNGNYTYDSRYSAQFSYRVDKADLFGADPEFRGRPLWSVGASWNINNEPWMKDVAWVDALKLRASYGLTGNIDSSVSSYLTAAIAVNEITGKKVATLNTPPNDQLRWEKTASWNFGLDFSLLHNRLSGSLDYYIKNSSDLLSLTDIDPTSGWSSLTINNGKARNTGVELQLNGTIVRPATVDDFGFNASLGFAYNNSKITKISHEASSGYEALSTRHEGDPVNAIYSYRYAGIVTDEDGNQVYSWYDHDGNVQTADIRTGTFTPADIVCSGTLDPKVTASFTPEFTWKGFTLSALFSFYGGHYMRVNAQDWSHGGYYTGYKSLVDLDAAPASYLNYWNAEDKTKAIANGYPGYNTIGDYEHIDQNVVHADYLKVRHIVLGYNFPKSLCRRIGIAGLRLRVQMNNVATWVRNSQGVDPEANNPLSGMATLKTPKSYTMSLSINL